MAKGLLSPLPAPLFETVQDLVSESHDRDIHEVEVFIEDCADVLYDLRVEDVDSTRDLSLILSTRHVIWVLSIVSLVYLNSMIRLKRQCFVPNLKRPKTKSVTFLRRIESDDHLLRVAIPDMKSISYHITYQ
jgi:hypothetical protein